MADTTKFNQDNIPEKIGSDNDINKVEYNVCDWSLLDDFNGKFVVYLGSDLNISIPIAERGAQFVLSIDTNKINLKMTSDIAESRNIDNLITIYGDCINLPLKHYSVDKFIVSLVDSTPGQSSSCFKYFNDERGQHKFFDNLNKYLKSDGILWLLGKNRVNPFSFYHNTPGKKGSLFLLRRLLSPSINRSFSRTNLINLVGELGFTDIEFTYTYPDYTYPHITSNDDKNNLIYNFIRRNLVGRSLVERLELNSLELLDKYGLFGKFVPSFIIKCNIAPRINNDTLGGFIREKYKVDNLNYIILHSFEGHINIFLYRGDEPFLVSKTSNTTNESRILTEYGALKANEIMLKDSNLIETIEVPTYLEYINRHLFLFKSYKHGISASKFILKDKVDKISRARTVLRLTTDWIISYLRIAKEHHIYDFSEKVSFAKKLTSSRHITHVKNFIHNDNIFLAPVHGDLWPPNIILRDSKIAGVIDFECFQSKDIIVRDLIMNILHTSFMVHRGHEIAVKKAFFDGSPFSKEVAHCITNFCSSLKITEEDFIDMLIIYCNMPSTDEDTDVMHRVLTELLTNNAKDSIFI